jgi:hypothetical protein
MADKTSLPSGAQGLMQSLPNRRKAQRIMEEQGRIIARMEAATSALVMENQFDQPRKRIRKSPI